MSNENKQLDTELTDVAKTWKTFNPEIKVLAHQSSQLDGIIVELIYIPAKLRRKGYCTDILNEIIDIATIYGKNIWLQPKDSLGTPLKTLSELYQTLGFQWSNKEYMIYRTAKG